MSLRCARSAIGCALLGLLAAAVPARGQGSEDVNAGQFDFSLPGARSLAHGRRVHRARRRRDLGLQQPRGLDPARAAGGLARIPGLGLRRDGDRSRPRVRTADRQGPRQRFRVSSSRRFRAPRRASPSPRSSIRSRAGRSGLFAHRFPKFETTKDIQGAFFNCSGGTLETDTDALLPGARSPTRAESTGCSRRSRRSRSASGAPARRCRSGSLRACRSASPVSTTRSRSTAPTGSTARSTIPWFGPKDPAKLDLLSTQKGDDHAFAWNGGFRWSVGSWVLAGAYRRGPSFDYTNTVRPGRRIARCAPNKVCSEQTVGFKVPDTFAAGLAFRPIPPWTLTFQYDFVEFTDLQGPQSSGLPGEAAADGGRGPEGRRRPALPLRRRIPQGVLGRTGPGAARRRLARQRRTARTSRPTPSTGLPYPQYALLFPEGEAQTHGSAGIGLVLQPHFQLDAAFDISDLYRTLSVSTIWKF